MIRYFSHFSEPLGFFINCQLSGEKVVSLHISRDPLYEIQHMDIFERIDRHLSTGGGNILDIPVLPEGTEFQTEVWDALRNIPPGEVRTYSQIAHEIGRPKAFRAVGNAVRSNPIIILIPCHRVVSKNGIGGFSAEGGVETKLRILRLEHHLQG